MSATPLTRQAVELTINRPVDDYTVRLINELPAILAEGGHSCESVVREAREAMRPSQLVQDGMDLEEGTRLHLGTDLLKKLVWPGVTPLDEFHSVGEERDYLALAMYRGYIDWAAVAEVVYWSAYTGTEL